MTRQYEIHKGTSATPVLESCKRSAAASLVPLREDLAKAVPDGFTYCPGHIILLRLIRLLTVNPAFFPKR